MKANKKANTNKYQIQKMNNKVLEHKFLFVQLTAP